MFAYQVIPSDVNSEITENPVGGELARDEAYTFNIFVG